MWFYTHRKKIGTVLTVIMIWMFMSLFSYALMIPLEGSSGFAVYLTAMLRTAVAFLILGAAFLLVMFICYCFSKDKYYYNRKTGEKFHQSFTDFIKVDIFNMDPPGV